ncbi:MAG: phospholipid carrier-dependent glycosyltransferase [Oscillospiraceae bacterium]|nr:phospholipid carrier-dependent glycosyltransferase [Oscillospiraceae bacterium]
MQAFSQALLNYFSQVRPTAAIFPVVLIGLIVAFFIKYKREMSPRMGTLEWIQNFDKPKFSLDGKSHPMERKDLLPLLIILAVYAIVAFTNLGSTKDPQSFYTFEGDNDSVVIDLGEQKEISSIMYYSGLYPGDYDLYYSSNGSNWVRLRDANAQPDANGDVNDAAMHQSYADLFKWQYASIGDTSISTRFIRIVARTLPMELGELALYDEHGRLVNVSGVDSVLLDEQNTIPDSPSWFNSMYFDEIYHGRTAYENIKNIYPYEITHPPLGKIIISLGIRIFGMTPFGYRFMGAFFGVLMLLPLYILLKNMFGKTKVAMCGTLLFAFEFMHFTQTRIATIDTYGVFFTLLSFLFMWRWMTAPYTAKLRTTWLDLFLCGLSFGLGCACKWTVLYAGVGLAALWLLRAIMKYRAVGLGHYGRELLGTIGLSVLFFIVIPVIIYCLSYIPYGLALGYKMPGMLTDGNYYKLIWDNQVYMLTYHNGVNQTHPYSSRWYQWLFDVRPILYYLQYNGETKSAFGAFNSPLISWAGLAALISIVFAFWKRRKPQAVLIWAGYLCQFLPWVIITRTTFAYHYFGCILFLTIAISFVFDELIERRSKNDKLVYAFTGLNTALFVLFYPVLSGVEASVQFCLNVLKWFPSWPWG